VIVAGDTAKSGFGAERTPTDARASDADPADPQHSPGFMQMLEWLDQNFAAETGKPPAAKPK
jgi:hypothetical protein